MRTTRPPSCPCCAWVARCSKILTCVLSGQAQSPSSLPSSVSRTLLQLYKFCGSSSIFRSHKVRELYWSIGTLKSNQGWFALAPLSLEVATSMGTCENQLFPPEENPTRKAYLKFKNLKSGLAYCQYGVIKEDGNPIDCKDVPADAATEEEMQKYRPQVLTKCVCTPGTECKSVIANAGVASVASTIFVRIALGTLLERFGPVNVQCGLMSFGAFWVSWPFYVIVSLFWRRH